MTQRQGGHPFSRGQADDETGPAFSKLWLRSAQRYQHWGSVLWGFESRAESSPKRGWTYNKIYVPVQWDYPPVIKHGLLENPPFTDDFPINTPFLDDGSDTPLWHRRLWHCGASGAKTQREFDHLGVFEHGVLDSQLYIYIYYVYNIYIYVHYICIYYIYIIYTYYMYIHIYIYIYTCIHT